MTEKREDYPVASMHQFLDEASKEFRHFRFQAKVNLIGSIVLLLLLSRFFLFAFGHYGPPPFSHEQPFDHRPPPLFFSDFFLLVAALAAVLWSLYVLIRQRKFVSKWGDRFEKLDALEKKLLPDEDA